MLTLSQQHLLKLAQGSERAGDLDSAISNLEEAVLTARSTELVTQLARLYRQNKQGLLAYHTIKALPDYLTGKALTEYWNILAANHFFIEAMELVASDSKLVAPADVNVTPVSVSRQEIIIKQYHNVGLVEDNYLQVLQLDFKHFMLLIRSYLLDPNANFAIRLSLVEECVRLRLETPLQVLILDQLKTVIPSQLPLMYQSAQYQTILAAALAQIAKSPSQRPLVLSCVNLIVGSLYPDLSQIDDSAAFASAIVSYVTDHTAGRYNQLFSQIMQHIHE